MAGEMCIPKKKIKSVRLYAVDSCGRLVTTGKTVLDWSGFESIRWQNLIDDGDIEKITSVTGDLCVDDESCPVDNGVQFTFTECKENYQLAALAGHGTLHVTSGAADGFDRKKISCVAAAAAEILFTTPTLCDAEGNAKCIGMFVPYLRLFRDTNERAADGKTTVRGSYVAKAALNARLFENTDDTTPYELMHWHPFLAQMTAGDSYYHSRIFDCPALSDIAAESCDLRALVVDDPTP